MSEFNRRTVLAGLAISGVFGGFFGRARAAVPKTVDVVVIGAGAAGIAAARRVREAGASALVIEAADHVGGRCVTDMTRFGVAFDRGAHALLQPQSNPLAKLARGVGADIYPATAGQHMWIGRRHARPGEMEELLTAKVRASRALEQRARGQGDVAAAGVVPANSGEWAPSVQFLLGPHTCGKDLSDISTDDYINAPRRVSFALCRQGVGTLLARLAADLPIVLNSPARRIMWSGRNIAVETDAGTIACRAIVLTVSTAVLASGRIAFTPELPVRQREAIAALDLGTMERIALEIPGNPFGLERDDVIFEKASDRRTAALSARIGGSDLYVVDVGGAFGASLVDAGEAQMNAFAREWLTKLFGSDATKGITRTDATRWRANPHIGGACAVARVGHGDARKALMSPLDALFLAGEAVHQTQWGTVNGAWDSGLRAAEAALRKIGTLKPADVPAPAPAPQRVRRRRRRRT